MFWGISILQICAKLGHLFQVEMIFSPLKSTVKGLSRFFLNFLNSYSWSQKMSDAHIETIFSDCDNIYNPLLPSSNSKTAAISSQQGGTQCSKIRIKNVYINAKPFRFQDSEKDVFTVHPHSNRH